MPSSQQTFNTHLYIVGDKLSSFQDIDLFNSDLGNNESIRYFYNKFNLYFNFLGYISTLIFKDYYYDYSGYASSNKPNLVLFWKKFIFRLSSFF